ncbi:MAG TPA: hypothetical protein VFL13_01485 [Candidatus Baltobacteraceae bacterium]|nr:hypothetical protein [Candidatus Baltobacteraceae bacterium]
MYYRIALCIVFPAVILGSCSGGAGPANPLPQIARSAAVSQRAAQSVVSNLKLPLQFDIFIPCADNGAGENVALSGTLHDLATAVVNANTVHITFEDNPQDLKGIGQTSGDKYEGTGVTREDVNFAVTGFPANFTYVDNFRIIGPGPSNNFLVHEVAHLTINANGAVSVSSDSFSELCK